MAFKTEEMRNTTAAMVGYNAPHHGGRSPRELDVQAKKGLKRPSLKSSLVSLVLGDVACLGLARRFQLSESVNIRFVSTCNNREGHPFYATSTNHIQDSGLARYGSLMPMICASRWTGLVLLRIPSMSCGYQCFATPFWHDCCRL